MKLTPRAFISATSDDLASFRKVVKDALETNGILPVEQTTNQFDHPTVVARVNRVGHKEFAGTGERVRLHERPEIFRDRRC